MSAQEKEKTRVFHDPSKNESFFKQRVGMGESFDLGVRKVFVLDREIQIYYVNGLCDTQYIIHLLRELVHLNDSEKESGEAEDIVENRLLNQQVSKAKTLDEAVDQVLSGLVAIIVEDAGFAFIVDVRSYPGRTPEEPDTEKVVRGARDGLVESIIVNTALIRRRIRDERLRYKMLHIGERSKTDICLCYLEDVADPDLVGILKKEIENVKIDGLPMSDKSVEEFIVGQGFNPFPLVRYTERADVAASHILEGHVIIIVDTSPSVIITPTTLFHHVQHAEEYRQVPAVGTFLRWVRFFGILASTFLLPLWMLFVIDPSLLPENLRYIGLNKDSHIPIIMQIFLADLGVEFLRMAAIHTPTPLSTAMGLIAAVLIGDIAINVGLFSPEVILYVSLSAIGTYTTPSYELSLANKMVKLFMLILVALFKVEGFVIGFTILTMIMVSIRSLETPYLWPFLPFNGKAFWNVLVRTSVPGAKVRPSIVHPKNRVRQ
ncbi:stage V sporulation protein AF [Bacillus glycinifermentans]|uniref:Spore germination protein n=1 Tax=Bacillus glycinifermentans TaxID=1664069 RepID=A0A0J6EMN9_9BACI|nr:spore germination protein [Bacillus glycinifermentans]ATH92236.1 spore germination protein [Bacillus glycinifermentans]KMM58545.1 stage V sporulation protein AF [Bacillus glycinifermentans]KRT94985.1 stage V sporulation protein AF [Bacillus glycinifermentans]MEC0484753.1 spore germination protein [Bacillus glycinifermentans]MEC0494586.1 spore germination protein [Bacillus glycinifermentans]